MWFTFSSARVFYFEISTDNLNQKARSEIFKHMVSIKVNGFTHWMLGYFSLESFS